MAAKKSQKKSKKVAKKPVAKVPAKKAAARKPVTKKEIVKKTTVKKPVAKNAIKKVAKKATAKAVTKKVAKLIPTVAAVKAKALPANLQSFITPLDDRMLVRLTEAARRTAGGLYIPDTVSDVSGNLQGQVVAVGRGHRDDKGRLRPMDVSVGDKVVFTEYSGSKIKIQNEDLIILRESEVMGVVSK